MPDYRFNGPDYDHERDSVRLGSQLLRVSALMADGRWRTLAEISHSCGDPESSVSAQLRHLRKPRFGSHTVNRRHVGGGLFEYQLIAGATDLPHIGATTTTHAAARVPVVVATNLQPPAASSGAPPGVVLPHADAAGRDSSGVGESFPGQLSLLDAA